MRERKRERELEKIKLRVTLKLVSLKALEYRDTEYLKTRTFIQELLKVIILFLEIYFLENFTIFHTIFM